ncbi:hypothetical protein DFJ58DRAFT_723002 [Suillus subalutaceus]|uniref:uncharacterized protein n=1 Tax=Suillus subalutaceus TaxID=48586 RepID=UPI001B885FCC|nr:uncharacterized protein DFJ58DRAFT_723002 [Suillus subalutaceus]KAG1870103.1 hypothetical protein DFJ58DRAFT_723002 [Suillus subalutaceus]
MQVIMIAWLHAMYQRSRKVLIFLVVIFLAITITNAVMLAIEMMQTSGAEFVLSGTYQCMIGYVGDAQLLYPMTWIPATVWEVVTPCLAVWIVVKYFRELRRHPTRGVIGDCLTVLMQIHVSYFASFFAISCFRIGLVSPTLSADGYSLATQTYSGLAQIFLFVQLFVLGPRLIIGVRDYHAELVANSDTATTMPSIAYQERVHMRVVYRERENLFLFIPGFVVVLICRSLPNAEVHALDLSGAVKIVAAGGSLFILMPSLKDGCFNFPGPQRSTRPLKWWLWTIPAPLFILAAPGLHTEYL